MCIVAPDAIQYTQTYVRWEDKIQRKRHKPEHKLLTNLEDKLWFFFSLSPSSIRLFDHLYGTEIELNLVESICGSDFLVHNSMATVRIVHFPL